MSRRLSRDLSITASLFGLIFLWIAVELCVQIPAFQMPAPGGPYAVGTRTFLLVDESRHDGESPLHNGYRTLSIQVWYPAEPVGREARTTFMRRDIREEMDRLGGMPAFFFSYLDAVPTNSYWNAEPAHAAARFPVVLYSPSGNSSLHKLLFEELASQGYVAVSISHPHWGNVLFDEQGGVTPQGSGDERAAAWWREQSSDAVQDAKGRILSTNDVKVLKEAQVALNRAVPLAIMELREWSQDDAFVLGYLAQMNGAGGFFDGRLDLDRTGVMGFSLGGANAGQFCATDPRCRAGINLDGFMFGDILQRGLRVPFMFIHSDHSHLRPGLTAAYFYETAETGSYLLQIDGTLHGELGFPLPTGEPLLIDTGLANFPDGARLGRILNEYILAFFNKYLKGQPQPLLSGPSPYPEVLLKCRNAD